jgi:hypothetical protein
MVVLLDNLVAFNAKCVEDVKRLAVCEANLGLPGNPVIVVCVVMQEFNASDCGQNTVEKVEDRLASADQRAFATAGLSGVRSVASLAHGTCDMFFAAMASKYAFTLCCRAFRVREYC